MPPQRLTDQTVAVVGSGPSGLACAQQLTRAGHTVVVYERDDAIGGLMRYGIPNFKLDKRLIDRRVEQMEAEGTVFRTGVEIGKDISWDDLRSRYDAVVVAIGSTVPRDMKIPGRELKGIHFAMEFLPDATRRVYGVKPVNDITAEGKHVVIQANARPTNRGRLSHACTRRPPPWRKVLKLSVPNTCTARIP